MLIDEKINHVIGVIPEDYTNMTIEERFRPASGADISSEDAAHPRPKKRKKRKKKKKKDKC